MSIRPPPLSKNEEKYREEILDRIRTPPATRTIHEEDRIQWIRMEELGKALTNRCRAARKLKEKRRKTQRGTIDRHTNREQLEFECQLKTPTRSLIHELLNLGASSSHNLFQSLPG